MYHHASNLTCGIIEKKLELEQELEQTLKLEQLDRMDKGITDGKFVTRKLKSFARK